MRIAAAAYPPTALSSIAEFEDKARKWVSDAAERGADLIVFPEYGAMELAHIAGAVAAADVASSLAAAADLAEEAAGFWRRLASDYAIHILTPSGPVRDEQQGLVNRAAFFAPDGLIGFQDKRIMTPYEKDVAGIAPGEPLRLFDTALGRIGVLICYDAEFPLLARGLVEGGADILLVPSCTDALAGHHRVRIAARARALEGQCITVQAPLVGPAHWCPMIDENIGCAGIFGPPDHGFPETGILAQTEMNVPGLAIADIDIGHLARVRSQGQVTNHRDWQVSQARSDVDLP